MPCTLVPSTNTIDFGEVASGVSVGVNLDLFNQFVAGGGELTEDLTVSLISSSNGAFVPNLTSLVIGPSETRTVIITFTAGVVGPISATLTIESDAINSPYPISLQATVVAAGVKAISVSPNAQVFPDTKVGQSSAIQEFVITNTGTVNVQITTVTFDATFPAAAPTPAYPATITPGNTLTFGARFSPVGEGLDIATLVIDTDAAAGDVSIEVSGNGFLITPAYIAEGSEDLVFAFGDASVKIMDPDDFNCEAPAYASNTILLPFITEEGTFPGFGHEKELTRILFHYEDLGEAVVRVSVITMGTESTKYQDVEIGSVAATGRLKQGMADIKNTDEVLTVRFDQISGPVQIVDWVGKYLIKGEQKKVSG